MRVREEKRPKQTGNTSYTDSNGIDCDWALSVGKESTTDVRMWQIFSSPIDTDLTESIKFSFEFNHVDVINLDSFVFFLFSFTTHCIFGVFFPYIWYEKVFECSTVLIVSALFVVWIAYWPYSVHSFTNEKEMIIISVCSRRAQSRPLAFFLTFSICIVQSDALAHFLSVSWNSEHGNLLNFGSFFKYFHFNRSPICIFTYMKREQ